MDKKPSHLLTFFICVILFTLLFTGCITEEQTSTSNSIEDIIQPEIKLDTPSILPDWTDGEYHDYYGTMDLFNEFQIKYPDLVNVFSIGESVLGKDIWCIRITNEKYSQKKLSCLIDGCIHGVEWEAGEACLYLIEYLLINFNNNETIKNILNTTQVYIVPLLNPDARENNKLWLGNDNGVDLNRNFDIFFGKLRSKVLRLGKLFNRIKIPVIKFHPNDPSKWWRNCGRYAFSEPESQALRDLMKAIGTQDFSFYVNCHTATHEIFTPVPWSKKILNPPYILEEKEIQLFDYVKDWVEENTEYNADRSEDNIIGGCTFMWVFNEFRIPSFTFEILSLDYDSYYGEQKHDTLVHWMKTTLPVFMYLLVNINNLHEWKTPDIQPSLPEGVPPEPLK